MNPFTTEHPLNSRPSWFDAKAHPSRALAGRGLALALGLTPFTLYGLFYWVVEAEDGVTTPETLTLAGLWRFLMVGGAFAFVCSVAIAFLTMGVWRFVKCQWQRRCVTSSFKE